MTIRNVDYFVDLSYEYTEERIRRVNERTGRDIKLDYYKKGWGIFSSYIYQVIIDDTVMFEDYEYHRVAAYVKGLNDAYRIRKEELVG